MAFLLPIYISLVCLGLTPGLFGTAAHAGKHEVKGLGKGPRCVDTEGNVARPVCTCELADGSKVDCRSGDCPGKEAKSFDCPEDGAVLNYGDYNLKYTCPGEEVLSCSCGGMEEVAETPPFMDCTQCPSREWNLECTGR